jgi:DNA repair protein RecO (recombination protein O)
MQLVSTDALVLRSYNLGEADRIVVCFTRDAGLVRAVAKGARRMKSRFGAALEPFTLIRLAFHEKENRELVTVSAAEIIKSNFDLAANLETADALAHMAELITEFAPPHEANEILFRMIAACVNALATNLTADRALLRYFEIWLLRIAGSFPDTSHCANCQRAIAAEETVYLDNESSIKCGTCRKPMDTRVAGEVQQVIRRTQNLSPTDFAGAYESFSKETNVQLASLTHRLIVRALERLPKIMMASARP